MRISWKRFNKLAKEKGWTPMFRGLQICPTEHQVWTFKEHPTITAYKPKASTEEA